MWIIIPLLLSACATTRVTEESAVLPLTNQNRESQLAVVNDVMARFQFTPLADQAESWIETPASGNSRVLQARHFEHSGTSARKPCTAVLSLTRDQLRVSLQGPNCSTRASAIAQSLRSRWQEEASTL